MLALLSKPDADNATLLFAAAMAQNATALDPAGCCATLRSLGADAVLASLLTRATDEDVSEHAAGALAFLEKWAWNRTVTLRILACLAKVSDTGRSLLVKQNGVERVRAGFVVFQHLLGKLRDVDASV